MLIEIARPVRRGPARTTSSTQLQRSLKMAEFHAEPSERCEGIDDEPTAVAGVVIVLVGIQLCLDRAVHTDGVSDPLLFPPRVGGPSLRARCGLTKSTSG